MQNFVEIKVSEKKQTIIADFYSDLRSTNR